MVSAARMIMALVAMANLTACASIANRPARAARSSYGCMEAVLQEKLPQNFPDKRPHCLAGGLIARYCSISEAYLAGAGKEVRDLLSHGDAEWKDWQGDRTGVEGGRELPDDAAGGGWCTG